MDRSGAFGQAQAEEEGCSRRRGKATHWEGRLRYVPLRATTESNASRTANTVELTTFHIRSLLIPTRSSLSKLQSALAPVPVFIGCSMANTVASSHSEFSNKDLKTVGNYTLGRLIGKGSFGKVYLATHKLTNGSKVGTCRCNHPSSVPQRRSNHANPRSFSNRRRKMTLTSRERFITTDSSSTHILLVYTRS